MLKRRLSNTKWASLFFLAIGVALVQLQNTPKSPTSSAEQTTTGNRLLGFVAVTLACFTSGLAGVYFELVLKSSTSVDLWIRNVQLSLFSLLPALFTAFATHQPHESMFAHFGGWAWATVATQVLGGLVTALVIKFADNILKGFATSLSIILSTLAGIWLFNDPFHLGSALGASFVLGATYAYNQSPNESQPCLPIRMPPKNPSWRAHRSASSMGIGLDLAGLDPALGTYQHIGTSQPPAFLHPPAAKAPHAPRGSLSVLTEDISLQPTGSLTPPSSSPARFLHQRLPSRDRGITFDDCLPYSVKTQPC